MDVESSFSLSRYFKGVAIDPTFDMHQYMET